MKGKIAFLIPWLMASLALAQLTATVKMVEKDGKLWANVYLAGIADCPTSGSVTVEWKSPNEIFVDSSYEAPWRSCSLDHGTARTRAYRSLTWTSEKGKVHRATGTWHVTVKAGEKVIVEGDYEVK